MSLFLEPLIKPVEAQALGFEFSLRPRLELRLAKLRLEFFELMDSNIYNKQFI